MAGSLYSEVASRLLNESLRVKKGETITVETWNSGLPIAREVVKLARRIGCIPIMIFEDENTYVDGVRKTPRKVLGQMGKHEYGLLAASDAYVFIPGPPLGSYYKRITREEYSKATRYNDAWYAAAEKAHLRGVRLSFGYIGKDLAGYLGKSVRDVATAQLRASLADFKRVRSKGVKVLERLQDGASVAIKSEGGELRFRLKGETELEDGVVDAADRASGQNMTYLPPGFVSKEVERTSARGKIKLSPSLTRLGIAEDLTLEFDNGRLTNWSSGKPTRMVDEILKSVEESNRALSLLTIGLNDKLGFGLGLDRFVEGSIAISGFGFVGILRRGTLAVDGSPIVARGEV
ncbi:MAG: aminopeptidase [Thaumarchaeota archaeon]|nr:aminopeptidase [Nitrososphaerota archaeon]